MGKPLSQALFLLVLYLLPVLIVGIRSSNLKLFASEEDDGLSLKFTREF